MTETQAEPIETPETQENQETQENNITEQNATENSPPAATDTPTAAADNAAENATESEKTADNEQESAPPEAKQEGEAPPEAKQEEEVEEEPKQKMTGRTFVVTGASSGLGYEVARYLCEGGNDVILACRNEDKAKRAIDKIKKQNPNALATFMHLDLASEESVRKFVDDFHEAEKKLHVLVNNAGVCLGYKDTKRQYTKENFELTMGTNHLGHFLLTNLLLEDLKKSAGEENGDARIVIVSSYMHDPETMKRKHKNMRDIQPLDLENLFLLNDGTYNGLQAYKNSKAANVMFMYELTRRLEGSGVTVNAVNPGNVPSTDLLRHASGYQRFVAKYITHGMLRFTKSTRTIAQASSAICALATDDKFKGQSGKYYTDGNEVEPSAETREEETQKKLWDMSGGYLKMEGFEPLEVPEPPKEEEKKEEKKEEPKKEGEEQAATEDGEVKVTESDDNKTDEQKEQEVKKEDKEEKEEEKEEKKDEEKEKSEEKEETTEKAEESEKTEENKE